jgi:hypothetical protein
MSEAERAFRFGVLDALKDLAKSGARLDASILTTYAFNGPFYEEVLLRSFERAGSRLNIVLADAVQLSASIEDPLRRPRTAGSAYVLAPVAMSGAFHPKVLALLSEKTPYLAVGSHNATDAGFGHNEEMTNFWGRQGAPSARVMVQVLDYLLFWLKQSRALAEPIFRETEQRLRRLAKVAAGADNENVSFLSSGAGASLWGQLTERVTARAKRIFVLGPYFDRELSFLHRLVGQFSPENIVVGIQPDTALLEMPVNAPACARFVESAAAQAFWAGEGRVGFSHAKAIALETDEGLYVSVGSANPTGAAWLERDNGNAEANIWLAGAEASAAFTSLGLNRLSEAPALSADTLATIAQRTKDVRAAERDQVAAGAAPALIGRPTEKGFFVESLRAKACASLQSHDGQQMNAEFIDTEGGTLIQLPDATRTTGTFEAIGAQGRLAFIIVNDEASVRSATISRDGVRLLDGLGRLDQYGGFDEVFELIGKHILSDANEAFPPARPASRDGAAPASEPETHQAFGPRGISLAETITKRERRKLFEHGLVSELIAALIRSLGATPRIVTDGDAPNRDADDVAAGEESADDIAQNLEAEITVADVDWPRLVTACRKRVSVLINKLRDRLDRSLLAAEPAIELGRMLTVLCLVQKLRLLPPPPELAAGDAKPDSLVSMEQLRGLYSLGVRHLYGKGGLAKRLAAEHGDSVASERRLIDSVLLWFAREVGADCQRAVVFNESEQSVALRLQDRADLVVIAMSAAAGEGEPWLFDRGTVLSRWSDAEKPAPDWLARHSALGSRLQQALAARAELPACALAPGAFVMWKGEPGLPRVLRSLSGAKAALIEPGGVPADDKKVASGFIVGVDLSAS